MRKPSKWTYKKKKTPYVGGYERDKADERVFVLVSPKGHRVTFESHEAAKTLGWVKHS